MKGYAITWRLSARTSADRGFRIIVATALLMLVSAAVPGELSGQSRESRNLAGGGLAIGGYDPVAYFTRGRATQGSAEITAEVDGATYRFASREHRTLFLADPERYLPAYGGWCAWAVGQGYLADIDPEAWVISDGRLFLNFSSGINRRFTRDLEGNIREADRRWPQVAPR